MNNETRELKRAAAQSAIPLKRFARSMRSGPAGESWLARKAATKQHRAKGRRGHTFDIRVGFPKEAIRFIKETI